MDEIIKAAEKAVNQLIEKVNTDRVFYLYALIDSLSRCDFTLDELKQIGEVYTKIKKSHID